MKKLITAVLGGTAVASLAFASASTLTVNGAALQVGADDTLVCDSNGVTANWGLETTDNSVRSVRVTDISSDCSGAEMFIKTNLMDEAEMVELNGSGEATLRFDAPYPTPESINAVRIWIEG